MHLRCLSCANTGEFQFTDDKRWAICLFCGTYIDPDEGKIMLSLDEENAQRLPALRRALRDAFDDGYYDRCEQTATDILELLPNNFLATFYRHLSHKMGGDPRAYEMFMENLPEPPAPEDAEEAFERALEKLELREFECVSRFIENAFSPSEQRENARALVERCEIARQEFEDYEERPRDVFICFSAQDNLIAERIVKEIENEGYSCYIYTRNMPLNAPRYDERLKYAIDNARAFLVITSKNSLRSAEVSREMRMARENAHIRRIEYKLDETQRTIMFKQFFEGILFVDGTQPTAVALELLVRRVNAELESAPVQNTGQSLAPIPAKMSISVPAPVFTPMQDRETKILRIMLLIEDGKYERALELNEKLWEEDPRCAAVYLARVMCTYKLKDTEALKTCEEPFWEDLNYNRAQRFADEDMRARLDSYVEYAHAYINYRKIEANLARAKQAHEYAEMAALFDAIATVIPEAADKSEYCRKREGEALYAIADKMALTAITAKEHEAVAKAFEAIAHIKDASNRSKKSNDRCLEQKEHERYMAQKPFVNHLQALCALKQRHINVAEYICEQGREHELMRYWQLRRECEGNSASLAVCDFRAIGLFDRSIVDSYGYSKFDIENIGSWTDIVGTALSHEGTFGLCKDGTVYSVGNDKYGGVRKWTDIVAVTAGYMHVTGLRKDGTVVAIGDNSDKQCDTDDWKDIVAVVSGDRHTVGVRKDGTVSAVGNNKYGQCNTYDWRDIVAVDASVYHTVGICSDGTIKAVGNNVNDKCNVGDWKEIVAIKAGLSFTMGLRSNGTVLVTNKDEDFQYEIGLWSDITSIAAGYRHVVGLVHGGYVVTAGNNNQGQCDTDNWKDIIAIAADKYTTVGLRSDGKLFITGKRNF